MFGKLETQTQSVILFVNSTLLVIFKEDLITFSYLIFTRICKTLKHNNSLCDKSTYINSMKKDIYLRKPEELKYY